MPDEKLPSLIQRLAPSAVLSDTLETATSDRTITFVLSTPEVARDGHTLAASGWDTEAYMRNPVVLFAHDNSSTDTVIGRMDRIWTEGDRLMGQARFMEASLNPLAETVYQMVRQGFLSAVSVGFIPLDGKPAKGRGHGAFDFTRQELLEVSVVPVGAHPAALVMGRAAGIDAQPMLDWARRFVAEADGQAAIDPVTPEPEIDVDAKIRELLPSVLADLLQRHGRVLSSKNEDHLRNAHDCLTQAAGHVQTVLDQVAQAADPVDPDQDEDGVGESDARAMRGRRARALKLASNR